MNSFRELMEFSGVTGMTGKITEEAIRFLGVDWICNNNEPCICVELLGEWIPLFAEIGGKRFLYHKGKYGYPIGFYFVSDKYIKTLVETGGVEWVTHACEDSGKHLGFGLKDSTLMKFLIEICGIDWLCKEDNEGKHMGFYCYNLEVGSLLIEAGGSAWVNHTNECGEHIGFRHNDAKYLDSFYDQCIPLMVKIGGSKFVWATNNEGKHMGFYLKNKTNLDLLIEVGGPDWINHPDKNGETMSLKK